jgi:hypothetical protein
MGMSIGLGGGSATLYGPYHRVESPSQPKHVAAQQETSGEMWGQSSPFSAIPSVKAYRGPLPSTRRGIEFYTYVKPHNDPHPTDVRWLDTTAGVQTKPNGFVAIPVVRIKNTQV